MFVALGNLAVAGRYNTLVIEICEVIPLQHVIGDGRARVPAFEAHVGAPEMEVVKLKHFIQFHVNLLENREHLLVHGI